MHRLCSMWSWYVLCLCELVLKVSQLKLALSSLVFYILCEESWERGFVYDLRVFVYLHSAWCIKTRGCIKTPPQCTSHVQKQNLCSQGTFMYPGYMRVARLLRFLLTAVKLIIYKNIFKAQLVVHYKNSGTSHLYHGFLLYIAPRNT